MRRPRADPAGPGQESVWDYPRPPRAERVRRRAVLRYGGVVVADTDDLVRVLETSHPPTYYLPRTAFGPHLTTVERTTVCEWKGVARYVDVEVAGAPRLDSVGWWYPVSDAASAGGSASAVSSAASAGGSASAVSPAASAGGSASAGPDRRYPELTDRVAVYAGPFDEVTLDGERVVPQPGGFYGGWITGEVVGPFKGGPGSWGW